jgi:hypothetical protein
MSFEMRKSQLQEQEAARLRSGGQPMPVSVQRTGPGAPVAGGAAAFEPSWRPWWKPARGGFT